MKKCIYSAICAIVALSLIGCTQSPADAIIEPQPVMREVSVRLVPVETKTTIDYTDDTNSVSKLVWEPGDRVSYFISTDGVKFGTSQSAEVDPETGTFTIAAPASDIDIKVVYPAIADGEGSDLTESAIAAQQSQTAPNVFNGHNLPMSGTATVSASATAVDLSYSLAGAVLRFKFSGGASDEKIVGLALSDPNQNIANNSRQIELEITNPALFKNGDFYYVAVAGSSEEYDLSLTVETDKHNYIYNKAIVGTITAAHHYKYSLDLSNKAIVSTGLKVNLTSAGTLKETAGVDLNTVTRLTVSGPLNGTDIKTIRSMTNLLNLDLSATSIVAGGDAYCYTNTTTDNVIGHQMFNETKLVEIILPNNIVSIADAAFYYCKNLASITIPDSVTSISRSAFNNCTSLTSVTIGNGVTSIGYFAFSDCISLTNITIPNSVASIGNNAFIRCTGLTSVAISEGVTSIGGSAFYDCTSLASITIPGSVTSIGVNAFYNCTSLTAVHITDIASWCKLSFTNNDNPLSVAHNLYLNGELVTDLVIPADITSIDEYAFNGCTSLTSITIPDSVTSIGNSAFFDCTGLVDITIPNSVSAIGEGAFGGCTSLTSVTIANGVISIGDSAFSGCSSLTSITIPDSVTSIGESVFYECTSLERFESTLASSDGRCLVIEGKLMAFARAGLTEYTIPSGVTSIGVCAFEECIGLTSVTIPEGVISIDEYAFPSCTGLTSVTVSDSVISIGDSAFVECTSLEKFESTLASSDGRCLMIEGKLMAFARAGLTEYTTPNEVTSIGDWIFSYCTNLTSITISESVALIGAGAFYGCTGLANVYCKPTVPPTLDRYSWFTDNAAGRKIHVPSASIETYKAATGWSDYAADMIGYDLLP